MVVTQYLEQLLQPAVAAVPAPMLPQPADPEVEDLTILALPVVQPVRVMLVVQALMVVLGIQVVAVVVPAVLALLVSQVQPLLVVELVYRLQFQA